jgi:hypothetical protein
MIMVKLSGVQLRNKQEGKNMNRTIPRLAVLGLAGSITATALILGGKVSAGPTISAPAAPEPIWGQAVGGLRISATANKDHYACGEPVILTVIVQNVDRQDHYIAYDVPPETDFWITVVDQNGKRMPPTRFESRNNPGIILYSLSIAQRIPAGGEIRRTLVPSRVTDMTYLGRYTITVSRDIAVKGNPIPGRVASNPVVVSVGDWYLPGTSPKETGEHL